jgi:hypothetical protein
MPSRKARSARPALEPMEARVVPSALGPLARHAERAAAHVRPINSSARQLNASERQNNEALQRLQQQENLVHMRSLERTPSALPTAAEQRASQISNIFSEIGKSL